MGGTLAQSPRLPHVLARLWNEDRGTINAVLKQVCSVMSTSMMARTGHA